MKFIPIFLLSLLGLVATQAADRQYDKSSYEWKPELSKEGPVVIAVSLKTQTAAVYRNGVRIGKCEVSTGKPGHKTPTGIFHILNKDKDHRSKTYGNAKMPYSERLTWDGVALHAGALPGYPSSHGCIHLPFEFSKLLFGITHKGTTVVVTDSSPSVHHSKGHSVFVRSDGQKVEAPFSWTPEKSPEGPVSFLYSEADGKLYVIRAGIVIGEGVAKTSFFKHHEKGTTAFVCIGWKPAKDGAKAESGWVGIGGHANHHVNQLNVWFDLDPNFEKAISPLINRGVNLVITEEPVTKQTRSNPGFTVLAGARVEAAE